MSYFFKRLVFFFRPEVQEILLRLQGKDFNKVFQREQAKRKEMPRLRLLTDEQLKEVLLSRIVYKLQLLHFVITFFVFPLHCG